VGQISRLSEVQGISQPSMSKLVDGLVKRKWIRRVAHSSDRRQTTLQLTAQGERLMGSLWKRIHHVLSRKFQTLSAAERKRGQQNLALLRSVYEFRKESPMKPFAATLLAFAAAATGARAAPLSWQSCLEEASSHNAELRSSQESLRAAQASARGAYGSFLPQATGSLSYSHGTSASSNLDIATSQTHDSYGATLSVSQNLFSGFQDRARVEQARSNSQASESALQGTRAKVSFELKSAFASLLYAQSAVKLQEQIKNRRQDNLRLVELRFNTGRENKGSVLLSQAYLNQAQLDELQAQNSISVAQSELAQALGRDSSEGLEIRDDLPLAAPPQAPDFAQLALEVPAYKQALFEESGKQAGVVLARGAFFPSLGLSATLGSTGNDFFPSNDRWSVGATLSVPLFSGGKNYYGVKSAAATYAASTETRVNAGRDTLTNLRQNFTNYVEAVEKLKVDASFLEAAQVRAEVARNKYNNGLSTFDDWDIIENDLISRERAVLQSQRDRIVAEAAWEQAQGKGALR
jgi:outer membrane protein TolC